ncbi:hypothetical protein WJX74_002369 [Apatococcus lobatus]|uniref:F-box domain-containing protein n=1 Tax=Apatococcus lobatus TaxID=904363 RepID=A0AAW1RPP9_9CHLO
METSGPDMPAHLSRLPVELLQVILDKLDGGTLVMLENTSKVFRSLKQQEHGEEALCWTEFVARKKLLKLRRQLDLPGNSFAREGLSWKTQLHMEENHSGLDFVHASRAGALCRRSGSASSAAHVYLPIVGPVMLVSRASTRHFSLLHWHLTGVSNLAFEVGVIPKALEDSRSALHTCKPMAAGCRSEQTCGSSLQHEFHNSEESMIKIVAGRGWWHICILERDWNHRDIKRYILQEFHGQFSHETEMKLAMTLWGGSAVRLVQPEYLLQNLLPATSQQGGSDE